MINHPERNSAHGAQIQKKPESDIPSRQLRINQEELVCDNGKVSLLVEIVNGHFGSNDLAFFSQKFPEYQGQKIQWLPALTPIKTLRASFKTTRIYQVNGRLSLLPND